MAGKGDKRRPRQVAREEYEKRWDQVFGEEDRHTTRFQAVAREWLETATDTMGAVEAEE